MKYIIVKGFEFSGRTSFKRSESYTYDDSCHETYSGIVCGIKPEYDNFSEAKAACGVIREANPCGYYDVVEISD